MEPDAYAWLMSECPLPGSVAAHVFACAISDRLHEGGRFLNRRVGLDAEAFLRLLAKYFPHALSLATEVADPLDMEERADLVHLLLDHRSFGAQEEEWAAGIVAGACARPNHLWEDLGLRNRTELSAMMETFFHPLAATNVRDMKWKKFLYRRMCEAEGVLLCKSPICDACGDFDACFGPEVTAASVAAKPIPLEARP